MKRNLQFIISASTASVLAFSALAQDTPNPKTDAPDYTHDRMPHALRSDQLNDAAKASDIIGMTVKNYQGEKLGKVEDLAVDVECGRIVQVILSTGGFIGMGDTRTAVPACALRRDVANKDLQLDATKEKLKGAPKFDTAKWGEGVQSNRVAEVYAYYGEQPYFVAEHDGYRTTNMDGTIRSGEKSSGPNLSYVQKASKLMGTPVKNLQDEKIGKVENFIVDLPSSRIVAVIISSGGFIGMDDELSAVPPTTLRFTADRKDLQLDTSKEMLSSAPHFKANQWPDFSQPTYAGTVYHAYNVDPYFATSATAEPDNTARNVRDRNDSTLTPLDQGNSQADIDITAQIRKGIIASDNISMNAKNVKIITMNGHVTLRGPVDTAEEKRLIGEIAERIAQSGNVDNQLEVKLTASNSN